METFKIRHLSFTKVELPYQEREGTVIRTNSFLLDTGASRTLIPIDLLLSEDIRSRVNIEALLGTQAKRESEAVNGNKMVCYEACLRNVNVLGFNLKTFRFLVADDIPSDYAILGKDFIEACTHYHTAGCDWDFKSFDVCTYNNIWGDLSYPRKVECFTDVINAMLSEKKDLESLTDF